MDFTGAQANPSAFPYAAAGTFSAVTDVKTDAEGNLYVADTGNHRVLAFAAGARAAARVFGQVDFSANGINRIKPGSIHAPFKIAVDYLQRSLCFVRLRHRESPYSGMEGWCASAPATRRTWSSGSRISGSSSQYRYARLAKTVRAFLFSPKGIAVDTQGNLYVADSGNHRVLRFDGR